MPAVTIRNLSDETHRALRVRAAHHGRSTEAEIRDIIEAAVRPPGRVKLGSLLTAIGRDAELSDRDVEALQKSRDETPAEAHHRKDGDAKGDGMADEPRL
ncbi:plasmid stabilization protein [Neorhizobium galegae]|uniref:FitA-like ribbon-helix-helix domain-containing protein n=1 Tax=Neorhizobium galegae TaxID=399 RepID=UPI002104F068|nr:plasmid stabilization protein [Neorhizobium galegae]MCQ1775613.1 plasmid stabilization protein [Neorhizobium galegae]MCQ1798119.1 plasmid stabilization protein [Neorhizobium galegae]